MPQNTSSPMDLPEPPLERPGLAWTSVVMAIAGLFLLAANAVSLQDWIDDRPPGPVQARAAAAADAWVGITDATGIGRPRAWLHDVWTRAERAGWDDQR